MRWSNRFFEIGFNPRPCARGDGASTSSDDAVITVSIRAPARGATWTCAGIDRAPGMCFNPRPCARGDSTPRSSPNRRCSFQSAPLREGRHPRRPVSAARGLRFNPRPCARGDSMNDRSEFAISSSFNPRPCARGD